MHKRPRLRARALAIAGAGILSSAPVTAQNVLSPEPDYTGWAVFLDNDVLALDSLTKVNDDRNYTMGLSVGFKGHRFATSWLGGPRAFLDHYLAAHDGQPSDAHHAVLFGVTAFTPNELERREVLPTDRPYASLVFMANQKTSADRGNLDLASRSSLAVGALGLSLAKGVQRWLHNDVGLSSQDPLGWHNQISDGGELTALYSVERMKRLATSGPAELSGSVGYSVGYYTGLTAGLGLRIGRLGSPFYEHSPNPMSDFNKAIGPNRRKDLYVFLNLQAAAVGYNALLQGQFRRSAHTFSSSQIERLVTWAGAGFVFETSAGKLTYTFSYRSPEFKGPEARGHYWGGLYWARTID